MIYNNLTPIQKFHYLDNAQTAKDNAEDLFPNSTWNGNGDAYRHALFSYWNVQDLGMVIATQLGDAHEMVDGEPALEKQMDLQNNSLGRSTTFQDGVNPPDGFKTIVSQGGLVKISPLNPNRSVIDGVSKIVSTDSGQ